MKDILFQMLRTVLFLSALFVYTGHVQHQAWAQTKSPLAQGTLFFKSYEFGKAEQQLRKALRGKLTRKQKAQAWVLISLSQYNQAQIKESKRSFQTALSFDRSVPIPKGQAPQVEQSYKTMRQAWLQQHPQAKIQSHPAKNTKPGRRPTTKGLQTAEKKPSKTKEAKSAPTKLSKNIQRNQPPETTVGKEKRVASSRANLIKRKLPPVQPPTFWSRYGVSTVLMGVGVLGLGIGSGVAVLSTNRNRKVEELNTNPLVSGQTIESAYQEAEAAWIGGIATFTVSGALILTGASLAFLNLTSPTTPTNSPSSSSSQTLLKHW